MNAPISNVPALAPTRNASWEALKSPPVVSPVMLYGLLGVYDIWAMAGGGLLARFIFLASYRGVETSILEYASLVLATSIAFQIIARKNNLDDEARVRDFQSQLPVAIYVCAATYRKLAGPQDHAPDAAAMLVTEKRISSLAVVLKLHSRITSILQASLI
jgi:hypothetical protein